MIAVVGGILLAALVMTVIWAIVKPAVGNLFDWIILTFGNDEAVARLRAQKESENDKS